MAEIFLSIYMVLALLFPTFYSPYTDIYQSPYYIAVSVAYLVLVLFMGTQVWKKRVRTGLNRKWMWGFLLFVLLYNILSFYFNIRYLHWYGEQLNVTIAFLFVLTLMCYDVKFEQGRWDLIRLLITLILISCGAAIVLYLMGYASFQICNNQIHFYKMPDGFYEDRLYWIYSHKSEHALMLNLFLALLLRFKGKFHHKITFFGGVGLIYLCLIMTRSVTGCAVSLLILMGNWLDAIDFRKVGLKYFRLPVMHVALFVLWVINFFNKFGWWRIRWFFTRRDYKSLGGRTYIWTAVLDTIKKHPEGWGYRFGESLIQTKLLLVNNGHNIFINHMLRFSVPVGICYILLFLGVAIFMLWRTKSFLSMALWVAILIMVDMDYSLMSTSMAMLFLITYLVCVYKKE